MSLFSGIGIYLSFDDILKLTMIANFLFAIIEKRILIQFLFKEWNDKLYLFNLNLFPYTLLFEKDKLNRLCIFYRKKKIRHKKEIKKENQWLHMYCSHWLQNVFNVKSSCLNLKNILNIILYKWYDELLKIYSKEILSTSYEA